jgi:hypothetical protein
MALDLFGNTQPEHEHCLTARQVTQLGDLYRLTYSCDNRELVAFLLREATDLMTAAQTFNRLFLTDGHDPSRNTQEGLTDAQRVQVLTLASTCAYNATLYLQEAQRRRVPRVRTGWDPITKPIAA